MNTKNLLSDLVVYTKYAKYLPSQKRRENWDEIVERYVQMMIDKYCRDEEGMPNNDDLEVEIIENSKFIKDKKILPSMRGLQFAGVAIEKNHSRIYNCSYLPMDDVKAFSELMFLLLGGTGVGYSVQYHHVRKLPSIQKPIKESKYLVGDSIEGWADAVKSLFKSYMGINRIKPRFDYSDIRPKGSRLVTAGGKAPGPEPLRLCLTHIESMLNEKENGDQLSPLEVHDICCHIANAVLAGGIRRAALISLFSFGDIEMATCKHGSWWELNPQRGRANNSAVIVRSRIKEEEFFKFWELIQDSNAGEPGIYFTNNPEYGTNPCCEISLRPNTFCNLTEINAGSIGENLNHLHFDDPQHEKDARQIDLNERARVAAFFGTLQAGFTDFHYLRKIWRDNTEKDSLIGVGMTGICNGKVFDLDLPQAAGIAKVENARIAEMIGINPAARVTTVKPSGNSSCVLGTSSGIHAWHSRQYIRNVQCKVGSELYNFFNEKHPELIKVMDYEPNSAVIGIPQIAPDTAHLRKNEDAIRMLERVKYFNLEWVREGHRTGPNYNNVSATVSIDKNKKYPVSICKDEVITVDEWIEVGNWMWENKDSYNGLSVLPYDGGTYADAPFMEVDQEVFDSKLQYIEDNYIDFTEIREEEDNTTQKDNLACAGGACEIV